MSIYKGLTKAAKPYWIARANQVLAAHGPHSVSVGATWWGVLDAINRSGIPAPTGSASSIMTWIDRKLAGQKKTKGVKPDAPPRGKRVKAPKVNVNSPAFLAGLAWRKVRYTALVRHGGKCQCCGRSPKEHGIVLNVDHIKPRKTHPKLALDIDNLQVLCGDCNHGKGNTDQTDWRPEPEMIQAREF